MMAIIDQSFVLDNGDVKIVQQGLCVHLVRWVELAMVYSKGYRANPANAIMLYAVQLDAAGIGIGGGAQTAIIRHVRVLQRRSMQQQHG